MPRLQVVEFCFWCLGPGVWGLGFCVPMRFLCPVRALLLRDADGAAAEHEAVHRGEEDAGQDASERGGRERGGDKRTVLRCCLSELLDTVGGVPTEDHGLRFGFGLEGAVGEDACLSRGGRGGRGHCKGDDDVMVGEDASSTHDTVQGRWTRRWANHGSMPWAATSHSLGERPPSSWRARLRQSLAESKSLARIWSLSSAGGHGRQAGAFNHHHTF